VSAVAFFVFSRVHFLLLFALFALFLLFALFTFCSCAFFVSYFHCSLFAPVCIFLFLSAFCIVFVSRLAAGHLGHAQAVAILLIYGADDTIENQFNLSARAEAKKEALDTYQIYEEKKVCILSLVLEK
jgi:hypothetical protein